MHQDRSLGNRLAGTCRASQKGVRKLIKPDGGDFPAGG